MNRETGFFDQTDDGLEPALIRDGDRRIDAQAELSQAYDVSQIEVFKFAIVWDIEKDRLYTLATPHDRSIACPEP